MRALPDVTSDVYAEIPSTLQWVGMEEIAVPVRINIQDENSEEIKSQIVPAKAEVYVSLEQEDAKGIHMSRLHNLVNELVGFSFNKETVNHTLDKLVHSQNHLGEAAKISISFDVLLKKKVLISDETGYQSYPVVIKAEKHAQKFSYEFELTIPYSSTCPCSASLARQLYAEAVDSTFSETAIDKADLLSWIQSSAASIATPHSQRSYAKLQLALADNDWPDLPTLILTLEEAIGTPVQTAVKRVDEQEFARLNAENLMFCEDAARRIKLALERMVFVKNYWLKVEHQESLHPHNAVVVDQKYLNGEIL